MHFDLEIRSRLAFKKRKKERKYVGCTYKVSNIPNIKHDLYVNLLMYFKDKPMQNVSMIAYAFFYTPLGINLVLQEI